MGFSTVFHLIVLAIINVLRNPTLGDWKYLILGLLVAVEGPFATLLAAAAAPGGLMRLDWVFIAASLGNLSADTLWYSLGYLGKIEWLLRPGRFFGFQKKDLLQLEGKIRHHAPKILFIAKITSSLIIPSLVAAGLAKVPWKRWFPFVATGEVIWTGTLVLLGYYAGQSISLIQKDLRIFVIVSSVVILSGLIWMARRFIVNKDAGESTEG